MKSSNVFEALESRRLLAVALNVNFQPSGAAVPSGYLADTGATYGNRGNGYTYGWNAGNSTTMRDRNSKAAPDQRYDTLVHTQLYGNRTWEIGLPNGSYSVRIVAGDPSYTDSTIRLAAENVVVAEGKLSTSQRFIDGAKTVTVADGKLTISNAAGAANNKICFIQITSLDANPNTVSISATDSTASEAGANTGTFRVTRTGSTASSLIVNYTVGGSATNGADYNTLGGSVTISAGATFANITITPKPDSIVEGTESVTLTLKAPAGFQLGSSAATVTIADATTPPPSNNSSWPASWSTGPTLAKPRQEARGVAMDGNVWVFGGYIASATTGTQQVDYFEIGTRTWHKLSTYGPMPHTHAALAADPANHVVYLLGGLYGGFPGTPTNKVYRFHTMTHTWSELPAMPENHSSGGAALVKRKLHYFGGSLDDRQTDTGRHIVLDLDNLAAGWQPAPDLPMPRAHFSTIVLNDRIYAIGGQYNHDLHDDQLALVHRYDPATRAWQRLADLPVKISHAESSTFVRDGKIIVAGGQVGRFDSTDIVQRYDPATNAWSTIGKLPMRLQAHVVQPWGNSIVVTTGNRGDNTPRGDTWVGSPS